MQYIIYLKLLFALATTYLIFMIFSTNHHYITRSIGSQESQLIQELKDPRVYSHLTSLPISKDVVVHSAYFDDRPRNGHSNITIFFADVNKTYFDSQWILGCGVGNVIAKEFLVRYVAEDYLMHDMLGPKPFLYEQLAIECYDLQVKNGSRAFLIYKTSNHTSEKIVTESEKPLMIPAPRVQPTGKYNFTVVTCTKAHDKRVTWLSEFVRYQKTIGVDHVHISILDTFIKDGAMQDFLINEPSLREASREGYLSFSVWKEWYNNKNEVFVHSEILQKLDCMYRYRGTYDYAFPIDTDDFFTPRFPGKTQLKDYINEYCYVEPYGSCTFKWIWLYPQLCGMKSKVGRDGNVTDSLLSQKGRDVGNRKSVHKTQALVDATFHDAMHPNCLMPGYEAVQIPPHVAYVAHNRMNTGGNAKEIC